MLYEFKISTSKESLYNIMPQIRDAIAQSGVEDGICVVFCPHTTAGITINENADPDVIPDVILGLQKAYPNRAEFLHAEGNSAAHLKSIATGTSETIIISGGKPILGAWQGVFFCEFDPPRGRKFFVKIVQS
ncbi:MAG: secondary thiamine-phosphate synthase enzyme YjbQ [Defluviitaleaceae bacterium]|nr:secondary thiamine-phosphate synthase enzyme YjbQ [Defluviitaleaceae bacterium]